MNLVDFKIKVSGNPWNAMDRSEGDAFTKEREVQVKRWRDVVYASIDTDGSFQKKAQEEFNKVKKIDDKDFEVGKIEGQKEGDIYCDACGTTLDTDKKCYHCDELNNKKK